MGFVLSAAFLEWFLWLAAFLYCLVKVFVKAEHWTIKMLAIVMMIGFTLLRSLQFPTVNIVDADSFVQVHLPANHGRYPSSSRANHAVLPPRNGLLLAVVRVLVICRAAHSTMAVLHLSISSESARQDETNQMDIG